MRVGIAADHGGWALKAELEASLAHAGHEIADFGAFSLDATDDYPDFVLPLARAVAAGAMERGIALCGSGVGASVAANKAALRSPPTRSAGCVRVSSTMCFPPARAWRMTT